MDNVISLIPREVHDVLGALRRLDDDEVRRAMATDPGHPVIVEAGGADAVERLLRGGKKQVRKNRRRTWLLFTRLLENGSDAAAFAEATVRDGSLPHMIRDSLRGVPFRGTVPYPLRQDERVRLGEVLEALPALLASARERAALEAARHQRAREEAAGRKRAERLAKDAARRLAQEEERERQRQAAERKDEAFRAHVAGAMSLVGIARSKRLVALVDRDGCPAALVPRDAMLEARAWENRRKELASQARERLRARKASEAIERGTAAGAPPSRHMAVTKAEDGFLVSYAVPEALSLGSEWRSEDVCRKLLALVGHRRALPGPGVQAMFANADYDALEKVVAAADEMLDGYPDVPLTPVMVEQALGISGRERLKWTKDGRIPVCGTGSFRKWSRVIEYALHPHASIHDARVHGKVEAWRASDLSSAKANRKAGAKAAAATRVRNEAGRVDERARVDALAREAAMAVGEVAAVPVVKLAIMASLSSRWAKHYQEKGDPVEKAAFYDLKDEALRILAKQPWAKVAYRPGAPKVHVDLCGEHRDDYHEDRHANGDHYPFWDWVSENRGMLRGCGRCRYAETPDQYALFEISLTVGPARFSWHVPYGLGQGWLPDRATLETLPPGEFDGETGFMFGRPVHEGEAVLWPAKGLKAEMAALLRVFRVEED